MRWYQPKLARGIKIGKIRTITKFLWVPRTIESETRWLEHATWTEKVTYLRSNHGEGHWKVVDWWRGPGFPKPAPFPDKPKGGIK